MGVRRRRADDSRPGARSGSTETISRPEFRRQICSGTRERVHGARGECPLRLRPIEGLGAKGTEVTLTMTVALADNATQARSAVAGFLAGYCGTPRRSCATALRLFGAWFEEAKLELLSVRRAHLELFGRWMEETGKMRSTVAPAPVHRGQLLPLLPAGGPRRAEPGGDVRRPKLDYRSRTSASTATSSVCSWFRLAWILPAITSWRG